MQLKPGLVTDRQSLFSFAHEHIKERAAVPKEIHIVPEIPLTPVGKIYKPELKKREIKSAIGNQLQNADIQFNQLEVIDDRNKGLSLEITLKKAEQQEDAKMLVGLYPFAFTLKANGQSLV